MKKKVVSVILAVAMTASLLAGCGTNNGNSAAGEESTETEGTESTEETAEESTERLLHPVRM